MVSQAEYANMIFGQGNNVINPPVYDPNSFPQYMQPLIQNYSTLNPPISNAFQSILNWRNDTIGNTQKTILGLYDAYSKSTNPAFQNYVTQSLQWGWQMLSDIEKQKAQTEALYGPQGTQYKLLDDYYTRMANLMQNKANNNQAAIYASAAATGASRSWISAARNKQANADYENILKFQEGKSNALMNAYNTFSNLINWLTDRSNQIRSQYIITPYLEMSNRQNALAQAALTWQTDLETLRMQQAISGNSLQSRINAIWTNPTATQEQKRAAIQALVTWQIPTTTPTPTTATNVMSSPQYPISTQ